MAFTPITTQEEFDAAIKERLERERAKFADYIELKEKAKEADGLTKKLNDALAKIGALEADATANADKLKGHDKEVSDLTLRATTAEKALLKHRVANAAKLPYELAERLAGETEEEMRKDAETLSKYVGSMPPPPLASTEKNASTGIDSAYKAVLSGLNLNT